MRNVQNLLNECDIKDSLLLLLSGVPKKRFAKMLEEATGLEVVLWDERLTTVSAHNLMNETNTRGKKRKNSVDKIAAAFILQSYLDSLKF